MNYEEIKRHFENNPPPEMVEWTGWAKITDTRLFLKSCYIGIRNFNGPIDRCPAWWHLRDFYILMKKSVQQTLAEETQTEASSEKTSSETSIEESTQIASAESEVTV